jgi:hypothetical protein
MLVRPTLFFLCLLTVVAPRLPAQQHRDWPLCGIVAVDSLGSVQSAVNIVAWHQALLGKAGPHLVESLETMLKGTISRVIRSSDSTSGAPLAHEPHKGTLWLELGVGRPRHGLAPIGGNWMLLVSGDTSTSRQTATDIQWHKTGPLQIVPLDSLIGGIRKEAQRLIQELPTTVDRCRRIRDMPSDIRSMK